MKRCLKKNGCKQCRHVKFKAYNRLTKVFSFVYILFLTINLSLIVYNYFPLSICMYKGLTSWLKSIILTLYTIPDVLCIDSGHVFHADLVKWVYLTT